MVAATAGNSVRRAKSYIHMTAAATNSIVLVHPDKKYTRHLMLVQQ
jgi:hypothetical protein